VPLTETAYDRLATIAQNNELGAGMAVAMKDLEIRGAGNVLGIEQSGHVAGVGFDLYIRLVGEAVEAYRAAYSASLDGKTIAAVEERRTSESTCPSTRTCRRTTSAVTGSGWRATGRLAAAPDGDGISAVVEELVDRYGELPEPARRLVAMARLRLLCREYGVTEVTAASEATLRLSRSP